jgi:cytosine/adenosine deaminase-related metal-dependent hydrolase
MLLGGVTGVVDMVRPSPELTLPALEAVADAYAESGMRAAIVPVVRDLAVEDTLPLDDDSTPPRPEVNGAEQLDIIRTFSSAWHGRLGRLSVQVGPSGPQRCSDSLFQQALDLGAELRTLLHTHVLETRAQAVQAQRRWGTSMLGHLDRHGGLSDRTVLAHVVWPERDEVRLLAERGPLVVHNPASNCALGSGVAPLPAMLVAGVRLALGTDGATCNDGLSLFEAMKLSNILHRPFEADWRRWPSASNALRMATEGGAAALDLAGRLGRITPGYLADLVVLDAHAPALVPPNDLPRQLVMRADPSVVRHVFVAGEPVVRDRQLLSFDWDALVEAASALASRQTSPEPANAALATRIEHMLHSVRTA